VNMVALHMNPFLFCFIRVGSSWPGLVETAVVLDCYQGQAEATRSSPDLQSRTRSGSKDPPASHRCRH
jgi:hypothetical protein